MEIAVSSHISGIKQHRGFQSALDYAVYYMMLSLTLLHMLKHIVLIAPVIYTNRNYKKKKCAELQPNH